MDTMEAAKRLLYVLVFSFVSGPLAHEDLQPAVGSREELGTVHFSISCNAAAQKEFERGVAMLHSFWFEEAGKTFSDVVKLEPSCAMGYWGVAMSLYHPLWEPPDTV